MPAIGNEYTFLLHIYLFTLNSKNAASTNSAVGCGEGVEFILYIQVLERNAGYSLNKTMGSNNQNVKIC